MPKILNFVKKFTIISELFTSLLQEVAARTKELDKVEAVAKPLGTAAKFDAAQVKRIKVTPARALGQN